MSKKLLTIATVITFLFSSCGSKSTENKAESTDSYDTYLIVGTYTAKDSKGINVYKFNTETGQSTHIGETELSNPSYLTISKNEKYIYAVSENDANTSRITAFSFDKTTGALDSINSRAVGDSPCFVATDSRGKQVVVAEYGGAAVQSFQLEENGAISELFEAYDFYGKSIHAERQTKSYLHNVKFSPDEKFLFANDLGADKIYKFKMSANSIELTAEDVSLKAGSGPRHTEFHPNGKFAYTITEISGDVIVFDYNAENGVFNEKQTIKADSLQAEGSADIQITPNGKFLYTSNRLKGDGIAIFAIDGESGTLTKVGYQETGIHPRNMVISPNGKLLLSANRDSNSIQVFRIEDNGLLTNLNPNIELSMPVCLKFTSVK